jgi:hypothetical protein
LQSRSDSSVAHPSPTRKPSAWTHAATDG